MGDREARRESGRACVHRLDDEVRHPPHLVLDRDPARCIATHHVDAQSRVTDVRREVQRATVAGEGLEVLRERLEVPRDAGREARRIHVLHVLQRPDDALTIGAAGRREREPAVAGHDRLHAMEAGRRERRIPEHLGVVVRVDVDDRPAPQGDQLPIRSPLEPEPPPATACFAPLRCRLCLTLPTLLVTIVEFG